MSTATITEDWTPVDQIDTEPTPAKTIHRNAVIGAIALAAREHVVFSAADVRPHLPAWVDAPRVGAVMSGLVRRGVLVKTGGLAESMNAKSRNSHRLMPRYRLRSWDALRGEIR